MFRFGPKKGDWRYCGGKKSTRGRGIRLLYVCASCAQPWKGVVVPILEPKHRKSKRGDDVRVRGKKARVRRFDLIPIERAADLGMALRVIFETRPRDMERTEWTFCLLALALSIDGHGRSYARTAELGLDEYPHAATPRRWWSEWKVREACGDARAIIERRLWARRKGGRWSEGLGSARRPSESDAAHATSAA